MAKWRREKTRNEIELAAGVPDAIVVLDADGGVIGWDEADAHRYLAEHGLPTPCDTGCERRGHIS